MPVTTLLAYTAEGLTLSQGDPVLRGLPDSFLIQASGTKNIAVLMLSRHVGLEDLRLFIVRVRALLEVVRPAGLFLQVVRVHRRVGPSARFPSVRLPRTRSLLVPGSLEALLMENRRSLKLSGHILVGDTPKDRELFGVVQGEGVQVSPSLRRLRQTAVHLYQPGVSPVEGCIELADRLALGPTEALEKAIEGLRYLPYLNLLVTLDDPGLEPLHTVLCSKLGDLKLFCLDPCSARKVLVEEESLLSFRCPGHLSPCFDLPDIGAGTRAEFLPGVLRGEDGTVHLLADTVAALLLVVQAIAAR